MTLQSGQIILNGKYRILKLVGEGGMARVWLAEELTFGGRQVAIKEPVLSKEAPDLLKEQKKRFTQEIEVARLLEERRVSNVVRAHTVERMEGDVPLLIMEYMAGGTLAAQIAKMVAGFPVDGAIEIVLAICRALEAFHALDVAPVHRDIKPSNILFYIRPDQGVGRAYLADFGLAQLPSRSGRTLMSAGMHPGTPLYSAPEQLRSPDPLTPAADLYALSCVLFEMLTGKHYKRIRPGTKASQLRPQVPAWLDEILARGLAEDPWQRYENAAEMARALQGQEVGVGPAVTSPSPPTPLENAAPKRVPDQGLPLLQRPFTPYKLTANLAARTIGQLPAICDADWERAVDHFERGHLTRWLAAITDELEANFEQGDADELRILVEKGEELRKTSYGLAKSRDRIDPNARLEEFLELLGATPPVLAAEPPIVDLGAVGQDKDIVLEGEVIVRNAGRGYLAGEVQELVPWGTGGRFGCLPGDQQAVKFRARTKGLPVSEILEKEALKVSSNGGEALLGVRLHVLPARAEVVPAQITLPSVGQAEPEAEARGQLTVRNVGQGVLIGQVNSDADWLNVDPASFHCVAGDDQELALLASHLDHLEAGQHKTTLFLKTNAGRIEVPASLEVLPAQPEVTPAQVVLGSIGQADPEIRVTGELSIRNVGHGLLQGKSTVEPGNLWDRLTGWLTINPTSFQCRAGETIQLTLSAAHPTSTKTWLPPGKRETAIHLDTNAGLVEVQVSLEVLPAKVEVTPKDIKLQSIEQAVRTGPVEARVSVCNVGHGILEGKVTTDEQWLKVEPSTFQCRSQTSKELALSLLYPERLDSGEKKANVHFETNAGKADVPVSFQVLPARLEFAPSEVDLGQIGEGMDAAGSGGTGRSRPGVRGRQHVAAAKTENMIEIRNDGYGVLEGTVSAKAPWLAVNPESFRCGREEVVWLRISTRETQRLAPGEHQSEIGLETNAGAVNVPVRLQVLPAQISITPPQVTLERGQGSFSIGNPGAGVLNGTIETQAEWLEVKPTYFECVAGRSTWKSVNLSVTDPGKLDSVELKTIVHLKTNAGDLNMPVSVRTESWYQQEIALSWRTLRQEVRVLNWDGVDNQAQRIVELGQKVKQLAAAATETYQTSFQGVSRWNFSHGLAHFFRWVLTMPDRLTQDLRSLRRASSALLCLPLIWLSLWVPPHLGEVQTILAAAYPGQTWGTEFGFVANLSWLCILAVGSVLLLWGILAEASGDDLSLLASFLAAILPLLLWTMVIGAKMTETIHRGRLGPLIGGLAAMVGLCILFALSLVAIFDLQTYAKEERKTIQGSLELESLGGVALFGGWIGGTLGLVTSTILGSQSLLACILVGVSVTLVCLAIGLATIYGDYLLDVTGAFDRRKRGRYQILAWLLVLLAVHIALFWQVVSGLLS